MPFSRNTSRSSSRPQRPLSGAALVLATLSLLAPAAASAVDLIISQDTTLPAGVYSYDAVTVQAGATLTLDSDVDAGTGVTFNVIAFTVEAGGAISLDGRGYPAQSGPGAGGGGAYRIGGAGGGHASPGAGSSGSSGSNVPSASYGDFYAPLTLGSGGGNADGSHPGGAGGGALFINASGPVAIDGVISANGGNGSNYSSYYAGGGGAGGSIRIVASALTGTGTIRANGGSGANNSYADGGGGSGGRLALSNAADTLTIEAFGGGGPHRAGSGTVLLVDSGNQVLLIDNGGNVGKTSPAVPTGAFALDGLILSDAGTLHLPVGSLATISGPITVGQGTTLTVDDVLSGESMTVFGAVTHTQGLDSARFVFSGDVMIASEGSITADGRGFLEGTGPAPGAAGAYRIGGSGAGHGGEGGSANGNNGSLPSVAAVGDYHTPTLLGSGGGYGGYSQTPGGAGGGRLDFTVGGVLTVDGTLSANGLSGATYSSYGASGGGAGGSVWLRVGSLAGSGTVSANGGNGPNTSYAHAGGGSGGRIAIEGTVGPDITIASHGGTGGKQAGGAGTIFTFAAGATTGTLRIDNDGTSGGLTRLPDGFSDDRLEVADNAWVLAATDLAVGETALSGGAIFQLDATLTGTSLTIAGSTLRHSVGVQTCRIELTGDVTIDASGTIALNERGYDQNSGPAVGDPGAYRIGGSGGAHGGKGGRGNGSNGTGPTTETTDDLFAPVEAGSGGGSYLSNAPGGRGGGVVRLIAGGNLTLDGTITADGGPGVAYSSYATGGGGAGGAVWVTANTISGVGRISADGGSGANVSYSSSGGGAGGRILVESGDIVPLFLTAQGGWSNVQSGGAGTILIKDASSVSGTLQLSNGGIEKAAVTPVPEGPQSFDAITVDARARLHVPEGSPTTVAGTILVTDAEVVLDDVLTAHTAELTSGSNLYHATESATFHLITTGDFILRAGAFMNVNGRGFDTDAGAGAGTTGDYRRGGGGGGHGGNGGYGNGSNGTLAGGPAVGLADTGALLGSGGGSNVSCTGGRGGGRLQLTVGGLARLDGDILSNGNDGGTYSSSYCAGGGSGGAIWITAGAFAGTGRLYAEGGSGGGTSYCQGGGGAGGRIVLRGAPVPDTFEIVARGGLSNSERGGAGTIVTDSASGANLLVDGFDRAGGWTPLETAYAFQTTTVQRSGRLQIVAPGTTAGELSLTTAGRLRLDTMLQTVTTHAADTTIIDHSNDVTAFHLTATGAITVDEGATILADGRAPLGGTGIGVVGGNRMGASGGSYGGRGGRGTGSYGNSTSGPVSYGNPILADLAGSSGGNSDNCTGGRGGGVLHLSAATLVVDGIVSANGATGGSYSNSQSCGGGSGGGIRIDAPTSGGGTIRANGGGAPATSYASGGGGGGGRIAFGAPVTDVTVQAFGADTNAGDGSQGTIYYSATGTIVADNGGITPYAAATFAPGPLTVANLTMAGNAIIRVGDDVALDITETLTVGPTTLLQPDALLTTTDLIVMADGELRAALDITTSEVLARGSIDVQAGGLISATGRGFAGGAGDGTGGAGGSRIGGGGGGHGCAGGGGTGAYGTSVGGTAYGDATDPLTLGSGGGNGCSSGGRGGGVFTLTALGTLLVDGTIEADGANGGTSGSYCAGGGGAGGSLNITAGTVTGTGTIRANGGTGGNQSQADGGGGGGGRIALRASVDTFTGPVLTNGGTGPNNGCIGSIHRVVTTGRIIDLTAVTGTVDGTVDLAWSTPDTPNPALETFDIRTATDPITDATWALATSLGSAPAPGSEGTVHNLTATGLTGGATHYFAIRIVDADGAPGALSNVASASAAGDEVPPAAVTDLAAAPGAAPGTIELTWTAPADVGGTTTAYELRYADHDAPFDWASATPLTVGIPSPAAPGASEMLVTSELPAGQTVHIALVSTDGANVSALSNLAMADRTPPSITLTAPAEGASISKIVNVTATAADDIGVVRVELDAGSGAIASDTDGSDGWSMTIDTATLSPGVHTFTVRAIDAFTNAATDAHPVTVVYAPPTQPIILAPADGLVSKLPTHDVAGTADPATTVALLVNGAEVATTQAVGTSAQRIEAEAASNERPACTLDAGGNALTLTDVTPTAELAQGRPITASHEYSSTFQAAELVDGVLDNGSTQTGYWLAPDGVTGAYLTVDLGAVYEITSFRLMNARNASYYDRSTRDFRVLFSADGIDFTLAHAGTLTEDDIVNWYAWSPATPSQARYVRVVADTYYGSSAGLSELQVFGGTATVACTVTTPWLNLPAELTAVTADGTTGGGSFTHEVAFDEPWDSDSFAGTTIDADRWTISPSVTQNDALVVSGSGSWGNTWAYTRDAIEVAGTDAIEFTVIPNGGSTMVGLRRPGTNTSYTALAHALYFDNSILRIYEDGNQRNSNVGSISYGSSYDVRFELKQTGDVRTLIRTTGEIAWTALYDSSYDSGVAVQPGLVVHSGTFTVTRYEVTAPRWRPVSDLGTHGDDRVRVRTTLSRPNSTETAPVLDALLLQVASGDATAGDGTFRFPDVTLPEGDVTLTVTATDGAAASSTSDPVVVHIDSVPPAPVTDLALARGPNQGEIVLTWSATGDDGSVGLATSYDVRYSTSPFSAATWALATSWTADVPTPGAPGTEETLTFTGLVAGQTYYIGIRVIDELGNQSTLPQVASEKARDKTAPSLTFDSPADGTHHRNTIAITASASDNVAVTAVNLYVDGALVATDTSAAYSLEWDTTTVADGPHTVMVEAVDGDENVTTVTRTLTADNTAPSISIAQPTSPTPSAVTLDVTIGDNLTAEADLTVVDDLGGSAPFTYLNEAAHTHTLTVTDLAGNATDAAVSFVLDLSGPDAIDDLTATSPVDGTQIQLDWTAPNDSLTEVTSYAVRMATTLAQVQGTGSDGNLLVTDTLVFEPTATTLTGPVIAGDALLPVSSTAGFNPGDEVLLHAVQCAETHASEAGRTTWTRGGPRVLAAVGADSLTLSEPLSLGFDGTNCTVLVQRVPNYQNVTVDAGATLYGPTWDGTSGGILAMRVAGTLQIGTDGAIDSTGRGFRGSGQQCIKYAHGLPGETYVSASGERSTAAFYSGGGGGTGDVSGVPGHDCAGGGGGGHGAAGQDGGAYNGRPGGTGGLAVGDNTLTHVYFGGAGGQGGADEDGGSPGAGGAGGGAILIAAGEMQIAGAVRANGAAGTSGCNGCASCGGGGCGMGGGGGGAGGTIHLSASVIETSQGTITAQGATGGGTNGCGASGSPGAAGRIRLDSPELTGASAPVAWAGSIQAFDWDTATPITTGVPTPGAPGAAETMTVTGLEPGTTYYFAIRSTNEVGLTSTNSNVASRDVVPPSITITSPADGATLTRPVIATASTSDDVTVASLEWLVDGASQVVDTQPPFHFEFDTRAFADGVHTLTATVRDAAGNSASDSISVTLAGEAPAAPLITWPGHGYLSAQSRVDVVGTAEAGTTVDLYVNGALAGSTTPLAAPSLTVQPEDGTAPLGCVLTADGVTIDPAPLDSTTNLAAATAGGSASGNSNPAAAIDGSQSEGTYWYRTAAQNETLYYLGRITLAQSEILGEIRLHLWDGDDRSYYNYKVTVSEDGEAFETWADRTGSGEDYASWQLLSGAPRPVRYIDVYLSGNTVNSGAHIIEVEAYRPAEPTVCRWTSPAVSVAGGERLADFVPTADLGDGTIDYTFQVGGDTLRDTFAELDEGIWTSASTAHDPVAQTATITGSSSWGSGHLFTQEILQREEIAWVQNRVTRTGSGAGMWGLRRSTGSGFSYTQLGHAFYLSNNTIRIYEDGSDRGQVLSSYPYNAAIDLRIEPLTSGGARYWYKLASAPTWTLLYTSSYNGGTSWQLGWSVHAGAHIVDEMRVHRERWEPITELSKLTDLAGAVRFRATLRRPDGSSAAPILDALTFRYLTTEAIAAGPAVFRFDDVDLAEGANDLFAIARDTYGTSPQSPTVTVLVDTGPPEAIDDLAASTLGAGVVFLTWSAPDGEVPASYTVYRSNAPITDVSGMTPVGVDITETSFGNKPVTDGTWYYVVTSVDVAGNVSGLSNLVEATSDSNTPAVAITLDPASPVGPGDVVVTLSPSEPLTDATLSATLSDGVVVPISLTVQPDDTWTGTLTILAEHAPGNASFTFAGTDLAGNPGTGIDSGATFVVDTVGPTATITLDPLPPATGGDLAIELMLDEPAGATGPDAVTLTLTPNGKSALPIPLTGYDLLLQNGSVWLGDWHEMPDGTLHTGATHDAGAQILTVSPGPAHRRWLGAFTVDATTGDGLATFAMSAVDAAGNVGTTITSGETFTIDANAPGAPQNLVAAKQPAGYFAITWDPPAGDDPAELSYRVYIAAAPFTDPAEATLVGSPAQANLDDQPPEAGTWFYAVAAVDAAGNRGPLSATAEAIADPPPPEDVTGLSVVAATNTSVSVAWTPSANTSGLLAGYRVYLDGALLISLDAGAVGHTIANLSPASAYTIKVSAFDSNNKESIGASTPAYTWLSNPANVVALGKDERVEITWDALSDPTHLLHYAVYLSQTPFSDVSAMSPTAVNPGGTAITLGGLTNGTTYYVAVTSVNKSGLQNPVVGTVGATPGDQEPPEAPDSLVVLTGTETTLDVLWTASANGAGDLAGYRLYRNNTLVTSPGAGETTYQFTGLAAANAYPLEVSAVDLLGNESPRTSLLGYTRMANPAGVTLTPHDESFGVTWSPSSPGTHVDHYNIYVLAADFTTIDGLPPAATTTGLSVTLNGLQNGTKYYVAVTAVNKSNIELKDVTTRNAVPADDAPPPRPSSVTITGVGETTLDVAWTASNNADGDLAGYRIYTDGNLVASVDDTTLTYSLTDLAVASKTRIGVTAIDTLGNESTARERDGYTLMDHPANVAITVEEHERLVIGWTLPNPVSHVSHYKVYVSPNPFTQVTGLVHAQTAGANTTTATVTGLQNGTTYYVAVTTVNRSGGERQAVTTVSGTPTPDGTGPTITGLTHNGVAFTDGALVAVDGTFAVTATDPAGIGLVRFEVDGEQIGLDQSASGGWSTAWSLDGVDDGAHQLRVTVEDQLGNPTVQVVDFTVQLAAPNAPTLTAPANNTATNQAQVLVRGKAKANTTARVYVNGVAHPSTTPVDSAGNFSLLVTLTPGNNQVDATAENSGGESEHSAARTIIFDNTVPNPPKSLTATPKEGGAVRLVWFDQGDNSLSGIAERRVYRHDAPFENVADATLITPGDLNADLTHTDLPPADGVWYYRATVVNKAGTESVPSNQAVATSDGTEPTALSIEYTPQGAYIEPRFGVGPVDVRVTFSEPLGTEPFLSITPDNGLPIPVSLTEQSETVYVGSFEITENTKSGVAYAVLSARDLVNNRGTEVESGDAIVIDTDAPKVTQLTISPATPILNDPDAPATITVTLLLDEELPDGVAPELSYILDASHQDATEVAVARIAERTWTGGFILPEDAGATPEGLIFSYLGVDDLGNESEVIEGASSAEVYQGELPSLSAPLNLVADDQPGGVVRLSWSPVSGAAEYQVYRRGPGESGLTELLRTTETTLDDTTPVDGVYQYAVASVRSHNGQESLSPQSPAVNVTADSVPPGPPLNLVAELVGNGIKLDWDAPDPLTEPVLFTIYRATGTEIVDTTGLTPIGDGIDQLLAVDPYPSQTDHAYAVTARDAAGNESPVSNTAYLNPGLLPVATLTVTHDVTTTPEVSWTHPTAELGGYLLTIDGQAVPGVVTNTTHPDDTWAGGQRTYGVTAVDPEGVESVERTITLPVITAARGESCVIERGVINTLEFVLTAEADVDNVQLVIRVDDIDHPSALVNLTAGVPTTVEVVVGGYPDLPQQVTARATIRQEPNAGELVAIISELTIPTGDDLYAVDALNGQFTRGATGAARLTFHNTSAQEVELLTAKNGSPSTEVRFILRDLDGNVLATTPLEQTTGEGVVTLSSGFTVVRIPAGGSFTTDATQVPVPAGAPDDVELEVVVDAVHYRLGKAEHVSVPGVSSTTTFSLVDPPYYAEVLSASPVDSYGDENIVLTGRALDTATDAPMANTPVRLTIAVGGFERKYDLFTDAAGNFSYTFVPLSNEGGVYTAWANHPSVNTKSVQATFKIHRVTVFPATATLQLATNYGHTVPARVTTNAGTPLTQLRLVPDTLPTGLTLDLPAPQNAAAGSTTQLPFTVTGDNSAPSQSSFVLQVVADEGTFGTITVNYTLTAAQPALSVKPAGFETGVGRGESQSEQLTFSNKGLAPFDQLELSLLNDAKTGPAPSWVFLSSAKTISGLAVGDSAATTVVFAPNEAVALTQFTPYTFYLRVKHQGEIVTDVPMYCWVNDSGLGSHLFKVTDIYTATLDENGQPIEGVSGAKVELDKQFGSPFNTTLTTGASGEVIFNEIPAGTYKYRVSANGHEAQAGNITIKPGLTGQTEVFLPTPLVTIEWEVTETTIEDKYIIVLEATFETDVPAAVVLAEPASVALPDMDKGDVFYGEYTLTNYGLITAEELAATLPKDNADYKFELLVTPPTELLAKAQVTIPYRVTRLSDPVPTGDASGGGCIGFTYPVVHCYGYVCANGQWTKDCTTMWYSYVAGSCGGGGGGWSIGGGGGGYGGGFGGGGGGGYSGPSSQGEPVPGSPGCDPCEHPSLNSAEQECCKANKSQPASSAVDMITGQYTDEVTDLLVGVLGHDVALERYYYDQRWIFRFFNTDLDIREAGGQVTELVLLGVTYSPADANHTVFGDGAENIIRAEDDGTWRYSNRAGEFRRFDVDGKLIAFGDRNGRAVNLVYDGQDRLVNLADHYGVNFVTYEYDPAAGGDKVTAIEAADGRRVEYQWTGNNLTTFTNVLGDLTTYQYDGQGRIVAKTLANGKSTDVTYASNGVVASVLDADGHGMYFDYGYNSNTQQNYGAVIFTDGTVHEKWFDKTGNLVQETLDGAAIKSLASGGDAVTNSDGEVTGTTLSDGSPGKSYAYNGFGQVTSFTDERGITWSFEYDEAGNLTRQTEGAGRPDARVTEHTYDEVGNRIRTTERGSGDVVDIVTEMAWDAAGNISTWTYPDGQTLTITYNSMRQVLTSTSSNGDVLAFTYDDAGRLTTRTLTPSGGSPLVLETRAYAHRTDAEGNRIGTRVTITDSDGVALVQHYDVRDRLVKVVDTHGRVSTREYDSQGRLVKSVNPDGEVTDVVYETISTDKTRETWTIGGELLREVDRDGYSRLTRTAERGGETIYFYDGEASEPAEIVHPGYRERFTYDAMGNPITRRLLFPDGSEKIEHAQWAGAVQTGFTDALDHGVAFTLNVAGQVTDATNALGLTERFTYDPFGRLTEMKDAAGKLAVTLTHDTMGNVVTRTFSTGDGMTLTYDDRNRLASTLRTSGEKLTYSYDARDRVIGMSTFAAGATDPEDVATIAYDAADRVVSESNTTISRSIVHDDFARSRTVTTNFGTFSKSYTVFYDADGRTVAMQDTDGLVHDFTWDQYGRIASATIPEQGTVTWTRPDPLQTEVAWPNGLTTTYAFNGIGQPVSIATREGETIVADRAYTHDAHRLTAIATELGAYTYGYDAIDQITAATYPDGGSDGFTWDGAGNRLTDASMAGATWAYNDQNQLTAIGTTATFSWDARGNLASWTTGGSTTTYTWDAADQLVGVAVDGATIATYAYDLRGRRVKKDVGGDITWYLWGDTGLLAEFNADGQLQRSYGWVPDTQWMSAPLWFFDGAATHWVLSDHLGAPFKLVDGDGDVTWSATYRAFGAATTTGVEFNLRGSSQYFDTETGLHYNRTRFYSPVLGRYLSRDRLAEQSHRANFYEFADNNPVRVVDRAGLNPSYGGGVSMDNNGNVSAGGTVSAGGYSGLGGEVSGGASVEVKDCCKKTPGGKAQVIRGGQKCIKITVKAEAGVGAGGKFGLAGASAKLVTASAERTCSLCNKCGENTPEAKCCTKVCINGPSLGLNFLILQAEVSLGSLCYEACVGTDGFTHGNASSGPGYKGGFGYSGGGDSGGDGKGEGGDG